MNCSEYDILEEESILHRVLLLFQRFFQTDCWLCLYDTDIWNIIYSTHCLYSQVGSQRAVEDRLPILRVCAIWRTRRCSKSLFPSWTSFPSTRMIPLLLRSPRRSTSPPLPWRVRSRRRRRTRPLASQDEDAQSVSVQRYLHTDTPVPEEEKPEEAEKAEEVTEEVGEEG